MTTRSRIKLLLAAVLLAASAAAAGAITDVRFQNTGAAQSNVPVTFGQVFAAGDMKKSDVLVGSIDGATLPLQVDVKATHADGSVRHAIISVIVPSLKAGATSTMLLNTGGTAMAPTSAPADLLAAGFTASASATIAGVKYTASADQLLKEGAKSTWLAGPVVNEWQVVAPLTTAAGVAHPHLTARFAVRHYSGVKKARVDVTIENNWAYEPGPQNFTYDAEITVGGKSVYSKAGLTHLHHARWRKLFWWGDAPAVNVQSNVPYLISTRAVPNYDPLYPPSEAVLQTMAVRTAGSMDPMQLGFASPYMPTTGGNDGIGILPQWTAAYVMTMDARARDATLGTGTAAGSYSTHYRDRKTDRPVSLKNYPYMTLEGNPGDTWNPATNIRESFPDAGGDVTTPYTADISHQPNLAYVPYLLTGDYFYLEEMQFWAMYDTFRSNPNYRGQAQGLVIPGELRAQAWAMRTLAEAAAFTPDDDALKAELNGFVSNNLEWYNATYAQNPKANQLGVMTHGYSFAYGVSIAAWMDDFFTSAMGHAVDLGFTKAAPMLAWKAKFPVGRMTAPGVCWVMGAPYGLKLREGDNESFPLYATLADAYSHVYPEFASLPCAGSAMAAAWSARGPGDMGGISDGYLGYPSNMQPALAWAVDAGVPNAQKAWDLFMSRTVKPDYRLGSGFSIIPRGYVNTNAMPAPGAAPQPTTPTAPDVPSVATMAAPTVAGTWLQIGVEGANIVVPPDTIVRYGALGSFVYAKLSGSFVASNALFGKDPMGGSTKTVEAFTPTPPAVKPGKVTTPSNVKLQRMAGLTATFIDPLTLAEAKEFTGLTATSKGAISVTDAKLLPGATYIVRVANSTGVLDVMYPITAQ